MPIVGGLDIHRKQLTFDYLDTSTGQVKRGQIARPGFRRADRRVGIIRSPSDLNTSANAVVIDRITIMNQEPQCA
jgi:hypothetical protein